MIRDVHLIPGIWKIDGYTKLVDHIKDKFDVKEGENLFEFPYDWRRDNRVASRQLATKAKGWLDAWRQKSGNKNAKLIVIGHSMGGLIARHFIECREGWRDTRMLITLATPYRGSLYAVGTLVNGKKIKFFDLTDVSRSMTALHQLMPIYACYDGGDGKLVRVASERSRISTRRRRRRRSPSTRRSRTRSRRTGRTPRNIRTPAMESIRWSGPPHEPTCQHEWGRQQGRRSCRPTRTMRSAATARCRACRRSRLR